MGLRSFRAWGRSIVMVVAVSLLAAGATQAATSLRPVLGRVVLASRASGVVRVKPAGKRSFALLTQPRAIRVGATIDATHGTVKLVTAAAAGGKRQSGLFSGGAFTVSQDGSGTTTLRLVGGRPSSRVCRSRASARGAAVKARIAASSSVLRLLRGKAHGKFSTVGSYGSATVRGTEWQTIDRCDGTQTIATKGVVDATAGLLTFPIGPGQTSIAYCFPINVAPLMRQFCLIANSYGADGLFGFGMFVRQPATSYELCIRAPSGSQRCGQFPLSAPDATGAVDSAVVCPQSDGAGNYTARWLVSGQQLGVTLPLTATRRKPPSQRSCVSRP